MRANRRDGSDRAGQDYPIRAEPGRNRLTVEVGAFARHRLGESRVAQRVQPEGVAVLKSLVGVKKRFLTRAESIDCDAEAVGDHLHAWGGSCHRRDDPIVVEIEDVREIDLRAPDSELGHVRSPLRVPKCRRELTVQHVIGRFADDLPPVLGPVGPKTGGHATRAWARVA